MMPSKLSPEHRDNISKGMSAWRRGLPKPKNPRTVTRTVWKRMMQRCTDPSLSSYKNYGKRGIKVCDRWKVFTNFLEDMGFRPEKLTLDRINNDGNYEPGNCRWATMLEQAHNKRPRRPKAQK